MDCTHIGMLHICLMAYVSAFLLCSQSGVQSRKRRSAGPIWMQTMDQLAAPQTNEQTAGLLDDLFIFREINIIT